MFFKIGDLDLYYKIEGSGVPILMLHGMPADHRVMTGAFEPIFEQVDGYQRIYIDLPGMGKTTGGGWIDSNDAVLDVVCAFVDSVVGKRPFLLTGFSYGGYIARGVLHRFVEQVAGMMLIAPVVPGNRAERQLPPARTLVPNPDGMAQFPLPMRELLEDVLVVHEDAVLARQDEVLLGIQAADHAKVREITAHYAFSFPVDQLPKPFENPVLIVTGRHDHVTGYQDPFQLVPNYPRATYAALDRAGHAVQMEQPALFNALVREWLVRVREIQEALLETAV